MAKKTSVWGIDIGQSAIKALRCRLDGDTIVAESIRLYRVSKDPHQPEAEPEVMVAKRSRRSLDAMT